MKPESLVVAKSTPRRYASNLGEISPAPENIINRDIHTAAAYDGWLTNITEIKIRQGLPVAHQRDGGELDHWHKPKR